MEELTALWGAHQLAYGPDQAASAAAEWLRILADTRAHLAAWMARCGCTATEHRDDPEVTWVDNDPAFGQFVAADCATVDTSAHLARFTFAEAERIGARISSPPALRPAPALHLAMSRTAHDAALTRSRAGIVRGR